MKGALSSSAVFLWLALCATLPAAEPIVGAWQLEHQELNGQKKETEPVTLRVSSEGDKLLFAFAVLVNNIDFVSMSYAAKLDGSEAEVKNSRGLKVGTVQLTSPAHARYRVVLKGENRPESVAHLTVSADGRKLTSEADSMQDGRLAHLIQSFSRH